MKISLCVIGSHLLLVGSLLYLHPPAPKPTPRKPLAITTQIVISVPPKKPTPQILPEQPPAPAPTPALPEPPAPVSTPPKQPLPPPTPIATPKPAPKPLVNLKPAPKPTAKKEPAEKPIQATPHHDKLVSLMQQSLATLNSSSSTVSKETRPAKIGELASEKLSFETQYEEELVAYLESLLSFPEKGEVRLKLTLKREGSLQKIDILKASSERNRAYIEKTLATLSFPPFGSHFKGQPSHTFTLTLTSD